MFPTAEVRWFFQGAIPRDVDDWLHRRAGEVARQPPRVDHYLRLPGTDGLNVKTREGRIEIKQRVAPTNVVRFHQRVIGVVERWRKWSFELAEPGRARPRSLQPVSSWIAVRKERRLRTYRVRNGEDVVARPAQEPPAQGCELELTEVHVADQAWWTLAFEAFGDEPTLADGLLLVAQHVFSADEPPSLPVSDSHGYAAWLASLAQPEV